MIDIKVDRWFTINGDMGKIFSDVAGILHESVQENFTSGGRPSRWAPLKSGGPSFLTKTGNLRGSLKKDSDETSAEVSTDVPYGKYHQSGTKWMPMRPFMVFQEEDKEKIVDLFKVGIIQFTDGSGNIERS